MNDAQLADIRARAERLPERMERDPLDTDVEVRVYETPRVYTVVGAGRPAIADFLVHARRDTLALLRELERVKGLLAPLVTEEPWYLSNPDSPWKVCAYCGQSDHNADEEIAHAADCPWRKAKEELG